LDVARRAGVRVYDASNVADARLVERHGLIELDAGALGPVVARYAIGADGMWSRLRKVLSPSPDDEGYLGDWHAFRQYFQHVGPAAATSLWVWFEPDLLPGYVWSFPLPGGRANVGFGIVRRPDQPTSLMKQLWAELVGRPRIREVLGPDAEPEAPHRAWPIPTRFSLDRLAGAGGRALFVGDAARVVDPMTGEGIGQALETGKAAAAAIIAAGPNHPLVAGARYRRTVERGMAVDHRLAAKLGQALAHRKGVRISMGIIGASDWSRRNFGRWLFEDEARAAALTPGRWHRRFLARDGAYI
ncbi:MAG: FAD-dependent monooxygenase, partial [Acidimicrobiales bacterium]